VRQIGSACAIASLLPAALAGFAIPAQGQSATSKALTCAVDAGKDKDGNQLVVVPGRLFGTAPDGAPIIALDPSCSFGDGSSVVEQTEELAPSDARKIIDDVAEKAKAAGLPADVVDRAREGLNQDVSRAEEIKDAPGNQVNGGNNARTQQADNTGSDDDAMIAGISAVAGLCMVASAGVCSAAVVAILPSLLPAKITTKEIAGVASVINDLNQGRPVSPDRLKVLLDVAQKVGNASGEDMAKLKKLTDFGLKLAADQISGEKTIAKESATAMAEKINEVIAKVNVNVDCSVLRKAAGIPEGSVQVSKDFITKVIGTVENTRHGAVLAPKVKVCLDDIFVPE
jgi:hypothetical protein